MSPPRLRSPAPLDHPHVTVDLGEAAGRHARVLRMAVGDVVRLFDGRGGEADAVVQELSARRFVVELATIERRAHAASGPVLVQCVPKGSKLDEIVRAATEAGAAAIHLALAERSIARAEGARLERLARIAEEAAAQSEAPFVPALEAPASLAAVVARAPASAPRLVLTPREGTAMADLPWTSWTQAPWLVVGPEGGLSPGEEAHLAANGWLRARLATNVLRTEHAGPIAVAVARELGRSVPTS